MSCPPVSISSRRRRLEQGRYRSHDISPQLAASFRVGDSLRPYGVYLATLRNHGHADTHTLIVA